MSRFRVTGIAAEVSAEVRRTLKAPGYGHPAHTERATGYGPCRACLRPFKVGEEDRILFTYQPFTSGGALPSPGPVFIHWAPCERYDDLAFPPELLGLPLVLEAFGAGGRVLERVDVDRMGVAPQVEQILAKSGAEYLHIRNREAGCFVARIDRCFVCD